MAQEIDASQWIGFEGDENEVAYNQRDLLLYAIGVGETDLRYTYELHDDFAAKFSYPAVLGLKGTNQDVVPFPPPNSMTIPPDFPAVDPNMILHGEERLERLKPLNPEGGVLRGRTAITGVYCKSSGTVMDTETRYRDESGEVAYVVGSSVFFRGLSGIKSAGPGQPARVQVPSAPPTAEVSEQTQERQAMLYRLSGDYNPLHADPDIAQMVGFPKPIIHGLCTFGFATRAVEQAFGELKAIKVRFSKPAFPGETLVTSMWQVSPTRVVFRTKVAERDVVVLDDAWAELEAPAASSRL